jgi:hypothetical protein
MVHSCIHAAVYAATPRIKVGASIQAGPVVETLVQRGESIRLQACQLDCDKESRALTWCKPAGYLAEEGVSGTELRDGESSALRIV